MYLRPKLTLLFLFLCSFSFAQEVEIKKLKINNKLDHFAVRVVNDKVFFSSNLTRKNGRAILDDYAQNLYGIYEATVGEDGELENLELIKKKKVGMANMTAATFSKDGKFMYYTSNHTSAGENKLQDKNTFNLLIQRAEYVEGKGWVNITTLPFCDPNFNYLHPALSPDGNTLYFVSTIDGTKGKSDLYKVSVSNHETYGEITRLSDEINSSRKELFPFVSDENKLYYSSDRRGGLGGLDIYCYDLNTTDSGKPALLLQEPINSKGDDFSFFLNDDLTTGYISSRRIKGDGGDDLYYFKNFDFEEGK
ncbi:PD40 domain-containing protein [Winogradskyella litoriviva]|uniref:PD40 domain-containing protein n=1 Tax=Winogradskyella litoriviva TaxID=1220182 RepID=A0ABX2E6D5_9FLAO|nr:PD40 domain-containing protein [Winogradskyella litoriviva]NRD24005.1 PD40 domain-containing protein [Winogradskyella litoriviva]